MFDLLQPFHCMKTFSSLLPILCLSVFQSFALIENPQAQLHLNHGQRKGELKMIQSAKVREFYDLNANPVKVINLAARMPQKIVTLTRVREKWNQKCKPPPQ